MSGLPPRIRIAVSILALTAGVMMWPSTVSAVIIFLKTPGQPIRGYLVRQTERVITIQQLKTDGSQQQRTIARSDIDQVLIAVSQQRLASLDPTNPDGYREYAEELAEKRKDPDAQLTAIRLFVIAAYLAPAKLGHSAMLGLIPLARDAQELRRFRAMAYLLDPAHDTAVFSSPALRNRTGSELDEGRSKTLLGALRLLRQGRRRDALAQAKRTHLESTLATLTLSISYQEFVQACANVCPHCERGYQVCPECSGKKTVTDDDGQARTCPVCRGTGRVVCAHCRGNYRDNPIDPSLLRRILQLELAWSSGPDGAKPATLDTPPHAGWGLAVARGQTKPIMPLSVATLTEFDPTANRYRNGRWEQ